MRTGCIAFLLGILLVCHLSALPREAVFFLLLPLLPLAYRFPGIRWLLVLGCGALWASWRATIILDRGLESDIEGKTISVRGTISGLPQEMDHGWRFHLQIEQLRDAQGRVRSHPGLVRLNWYVHDRKLLPGERWQLNVRLKRPNGFMNPGGFDYEGWLFQQGIRASGYVVNSGHNSRLGLTGKQAVHRLRLKLRGKIHALIGGESMSSLVPALVIGDRSAIPADRWQVLIGTGTSHLLAISGLHIGLVAGFSFLLIRWSWPFGAVLAAPRAAAIFAMLCALAYAAMAGFAVPTQRALIMLLAVTLGNLCGRKLEISMIISLALWLVLILDPLAVISPGFWLSFGAIAVISYGMAGRVNINGAWWRWGRVQYVVALGLFPLIVGWFGQLPLIGMPANMIVVPWMSFTTVPLVLAGTVMLCFSEALAFVLLTLGMKTIEIAWPVLVFFNELPYSTLQTGHTGVLSRLAAFIGVALLLMPAGLPGRWVGAAWLLPLFFPVNEELSQHEFRFTLLDVGQGTAAVLRTSRHVLLYDTGPRFSRRFDAGSAVVLPYLRSENIRHLDLLVQSHGDNDHSGGLEAVLDGIQTRSVLTSIPDIVDFPSLRTCEAGMNWDWDGVTVEVLHPQRDSSFTGNNASCVLRASSQYGSILLTGDIEAAAERRILETRRQSLRSTVLLAPHHGSMTSSTPRFVDAVSPQAVMFSTAYRNRFGFPKQAIIRRYQDVGSRILDTGSDGAIDIIVTRQGLKIDRFRKSNRRFWNRPE